MDWSRRRASRITLSLLSSLTLALVTVACLGCGGDEGDWVQLEATPTFAGLEAVPEGIAVRVEATYSGELGSVTRSLIVPETGDFSVENKLSGDASLSSLDVVVGGLHYGFGPGDGVWESSAVGTRPDLDNAYGSLELDSMPDDTVWFKRGDSFRTTFAYVASEGETPPVTVEVTYEVEQDPATGILLVERLSNEGNSSETRRELVPLADVEVPTADTIYEYAAESWSLAVETLRQLPYDAVGLDLPGAVPTMVMVLSSEPGAEHAALFYSLESSSQPSGTVVQVESLAYGPDTADLVSGGAGGFFRRGDAVVRISSEGGMIEGLPVDTSTGLDPSLEALTAALVPIAQLSDEHFPLPASYTPAGTLRIDGSDVGP
jgi:hypothetical protein